MLHARVKEWTVHRVEENQSVAKKDVLALEEPLEIGLIYHQMGQKCTERLATTMRTPGADEALIAGFLFNEGIIQSASQIIKIDAERVLGRDKPYPASMVVSLSDDVEFDPTAHLRRFPITSSCGVCGRAVVPEAPCRRDLAGSSVRINAENLRTMMHAQRKSQTLFKLTGGLHAATLFDAQHRAIKTMEDIGRHNAMDKLVGYCLREELLPLTNHCIFFSGRIGYELMQKAIKTEVTCVGAVGAPSSLAVEMANAHGITLMGFARGSTFNVYTGVERLEIKKAFPASLAPEMPFFQKKLD